LNLPNSHIFSKLDVFSNGGSLLAGNLDLRKRDDSSQHRYVRYSSSSKYVSGINSDGTSTFANEATGTWNINDFMSVQPPVVNAGTININAGNTAFNGGYLQDGPLASINIKGGNVSVPAGSALTIQQGVLNAKGTINADIIVGTPSGQPSGQFLKWVAEARSAQ
jgi:hypothetical protein